MPASYPKKKYNIRAGKVSPSLLKKKKSRYNIIKSTKPQYSAFLLSPNSTPIRDSSPLPFLNAPENSDTPNYNDLDDYMDIMYNKEK